MYTLPVPSLRRAAAPRVLLGLGLSLSLLACSSPDSSEAPADAGTPTADLNASPITVTGTRIRTHIAEPDTRTDRAVDLSSTAIEALVLDDSSGQWTTLPGSGGSDGSFAIPGLPAQTAYYLHLTAANESPQHLYIHTAASSLDLGEYSGQRSSVVSGASGSALTWDNVAGLEAWTAGDLLLYFSSDNGLYLYGSTPAAGATTLSLSQSFLGQPLLSGARGDALYVMQLHQRGLFDGSPLKTVSRALKLPSFDMTDGVATTISNTQASFSQPPLVIVSFDYRRSQFEAWRSSTAPASALLSGSSHQLYVSALLGGVQLRYGFYSNSADVMAYDSSGATDISLADITIGSPFPASYGLFGYASLSTSASYSLPGTTSGVKLSAALTYAAPLAAFVSGPVAPQLSPVSAFQINGQDAQTTAAAVSTQPVLSWSPPQLGTASHYVVSVHQLYLRSSTQTGQRLLAQLYTTQTRLPLPPGLLKSGESYVFRVAAQARPGYDSAHPLRSALPASTAATLSTRVTP